MDRVWIVGIVLIKNEDIFIEQILKNILKFCDRIIITDNRSRDNTSKVASSFSKRYCHISYFNIANPSVSHELIQVYAGKKYWVFAVDGDELYDPGGLDLLREQLLAGEFDNHWMILGNVLNVIELDTTEMTARGYLSPPCRSMTKLYNFNLIESWKGPCSERLHGGKILFKSGFRRDLRYDLSLMSSWENSSFRCLHMCFLRRSSIEPIHTDQVSARKNIAELGQERLPRKIVTTINRILRIPETSVLKREKYMRGAIVKKSVTSFFDHEVSVPRNETYK